MGDVSGVLLAVGFAAPLAGLVAAVLLLVRHADRSQQRAGGEATGQPLLYPSVVRFVMWSSIATAFVLPWGTAVAVKLVLQHRGLPTLPWSSFLSPLAIAVLIPVTLFMWAFPFPALGLFARYVYLRHVPSRAEFKARLLALGTAYMSGAAAGIFVYWGLFREFDLLYIFVPAGMYVAVPMVAGWLLALGVIGLRRKLSSSGVV